MELRKYSLFTLSLASIGLGMYLTIALGALSISPGMGTNSVGVGSLRTATGSVYSTTDVILTMNDYSFFPSVTDPTSTNWDWRPTPIADPVDTVSRIRWATAGSGQLTIRWRYVTASDKPRIWVLHNPATGEITATWVSDDPCTKDDITPCLSDPKGVTVAKQFNSSKLEAISLTSQELEEARKVSSHPFNLRYRALQIKTNSDSPSKWIHNNMKVRLSDGTLVCKKSC